MSAPRRAASAFEAPDRVLDAVAGSFGGPAVLVVGDLMLDRYLRGAATRISPEAPVPVVVVERETETAGGAANVAANLRGLGLRVALAGVVGDDAPGRRLVAGLEAAGVDARAIVTATDGRPTITKTRVLGGHQQMLRFDAEVAAPLADADAARLVALALARLDEGPAALLLSDYAKGVLGAATCRRLVAAARERGVPVLVDPKGADFSKYAGATTVTPNRGELALATGARADDTEELLRRGGALRAALGLDYLVVTRGEQGVTYVAADRTVTLPAVARDVFDVSGAGDTLVAALAAGLCAGLEPLDALRLANVAAGIIVSKLGTAVLDRAELADAVLALARPAGSAGKVLARDEAAARVAAWRASGQRVVFTNGCFDLLHVGHVTLLERARAEGDRLVVGLNTDASVRAFKGPSRPLVREADRARVLAAFAAVDAVTLFDEATPLELVVALRPDVIAKGGDYSPGTVVGAAEVTAWGGEVVIVPLVDGHSTTALAAAARER